MVVNSKEIDRTFKDFVLSFLYNCFFVAKTFFTVYFIVSELVYSEL